MSVRLETFGRHPTSSTPVGQDVGHTTTSRDGHSTRTADDWPGSAADEAEGTEATYIAPRAEPVRPSTSGEYGNARYGLWREASRGVGRVRVDPRVMSGQPTIGDTRIAVAQILGLLADGYDVAGVVDQFDGLIAVEDVQDALLFAAGLSS